MRIFHNFMRNLEFQIIRYIYDIIFSSLSYSLFLQYTHCLQLRQIVAYLVGRYTFRQELQGTLGPGPSVPLYENYE